MNNSFVAKGILIFLLKLRRRLSSKNYIVLIALIIGLLAGIAAVLLKQAVHYVEFGLQFWFKKEYANVPYFFYPFVGIMLSVLYVKFFLKDNFEKGLSNLIFKLSKNKTDIHFHNIHSNIITSALTVGFGGSVGLEAPIVAIGSAVGSNIARILRFNLKDKTLLVGCGAAAGIAGIFNAPIGGVIFVMEVLLPEFSIPAFIPLLISSAVGAVISKALMPEGTLFTLVTQGWEFKAIPYYFILGGICGIISLYVIKMTLAVEEFSKISKSKIRKAIVGSLVLGILVFIFPPLFGEGFGHIAEIFKGNYGDLLKNSFFYSLNSSPLLIILISILLILIKVFASSVTMAAGGNGGIIAPSLFIGAFTGFVFVYSLEALGLQQFRNENFIAVGMAGVLSGVINAPLTAIFLIAEGTGGYSLMIPLMIVSAMSFFVKRYFEPYSIYTKLLAERGEWNPNNTDLKLLSEITVLELIERDAPLFYPHNTLRELTDRIAHCDKSVFPVVDKKGRYKGIVLLNDLREIMFSQEIYDAVIVTDLMQTTEETIDIDENIDSVMHKFENSIKSSLPVVCKGKYEGFISKTAILNRYREELLKQKRMYE